MCRGVKYRFSKSHNFQNLPVCGYCCIKHDKTTNIASILMIFEILVVKILIKHKINEVLYFLVKTVFEQLIKGVSFRTNCFSQKLEMVM